MTTATGLTSSAKSLSVDLVDLFGHQVMGMLTYRVTGVSTITIEFIKIDDHPLWNALEIVKVT